MSRLVLMSLLLVGCVDGGDEGLTVISNSASDTCSFTGEKSQPFRAHGTIWTGSPSGYVFTPLIESRITAIEGGDEAQRSIAITGANVSLEVKAATLENDGTFTATTVNLTKEQSQFSQLFSAPLPPSGTVNVLFELIPRQTLAAIGAVAGTSALEAEVLATIRVFGRFNGNDIESAPFQFPVTVCTDCVVNNLGSCTDFSGTARNTGNACNAFQDGVIDCCESALRPGQLLCPAVAEEPPQQQ